MNETTPLGSRRRVLDQLAPRRRPRIGRALLLFPLDLALYLLLWTALLSAPLWWMKLILALAAALSIARLFLIGHDACHGSYFGPRWANAIAGRVAFLPSYTPFSTWEFGHNTLHHGFTNLRGKDYVYTPFSKAEFDALPKWRRLMERAYRHPLGPGLHYLLEVWWKKLWFPQARHVGQVRASYKADSLLTGLFLAGQVALVLLSAARENQNPAVLAMWAIGVPFVTWNLLMGFITFQQHTNPSVVWYAHRRDWDPVKAQVESTPHIVFPWPLGALLGNIMEHTAHHLDVTIPFFDLAGAQSEVDRIFSGQVKVVRWTWRYYTWCCRRCKLYDYQARQWVGFDGTPAPRRLGRRVASARSPA
jgi:omega-6 fatty acid desaturase (delta-12 desaturase)